MQETGGPTGPPSLFLISTEFSRNDSTIIRTNIFNKFVICDDKSLGNFRQNVFMTLENFFYLSVSIYSILAIFLMLFIAILALMLFKKLLKIEKSLQEIAERGKIAAESARSMMESGEKILLVGLYRILKKIGRRWENDY